MPTFSYSGKAREDQRKLVMHIAKKMAASYTIFLTKSVSV